MSDKLKYLKTRLQGHSYYDVTGTAGNIVPHYVDCRPLLMDTEFMVPVCHELSFTTFIDARHTFIGIETGGALLASGLGVRNGLPAAFITKGKTNFLPGRRLVGCTSTAVYIVDDVVTTGGTMIAAVKLLRELGLRVQGALCIVDHKAHGGWIKLLTETNVTLYSLFTMDEHGNLTSPSHITME